MTGFLGAAYPWVLAGHVIFVIFLMASLFMMPRYFVYHHQAAPGSAEDTLWVERDMRLKLFIMFPAIVMVWLLWLALAFNVFGWSQTLFHG